MNIKKLLATRGVHFLATRFGSKDLQKLAFDEKYKAGDWSFKDDGAGELIEIIIRYNPAAELLLMGCGTASILEDSRSANFRSVLGVDLSPEAIRLASKHASDKITFMLADMTSYRIPKAFDVILFSESLYYVPANAQVGFMKRIVSHLNVGGAIIVTVAQATRYANILEGIRKNFTIHEDRQFRKSKRHLIVFS